MDHIWRLFSNRRITKTCLIMNQVRWGKKGACIELFEHSQTRAHRPFTWQLRYRIKNALRCSLQELIENFLPFDRLMSEGAKEKGKSKMTWEHQTHQILGTLEGKDKHPRSTVIGSEKLRGLTQRFQNLEGNTMRMAKGTIQEKAWRYDFRVKSIK